MEQFQVDGRNRVRQIREYANYDMRAVHTILDSAFVGHVGFVQDEQPFVIPMLYAREGSTLYLHGARKARIVKQLASGAPICMNVTLVDGIVVARSAFHSSMNYRSAVVFGSGRLLENDAEILHALEIVSEHVFPGRWKELRAPSAREIAMTGVVAIDIDSASAKVADDLPDDEETDYETPIWAGVVPIETTLGEPFDDGRVQDGVEISASIASLRNRRL